MTTTACLVLRLLRRLGLGRPPQGYAVGRLGWILFLGLLFHPSGARAAVIYEFSGQFTSAGSGALSAISANAAYIGRLRYDVTQVGNRVGGIDNRVEYRYDPAGTSAISVVLPNSGITAAQGPTTLIAETTFCLRFCIDTFSISSFDVPVYGLGVSVLTSPTFSVAGTSLFVDSPVSWSPTGLPTALPTQSAFGPVSPTITMTAGSTQLQATVDRQTALPDNEEDEVPEPRTTLTVLSSFAVFHSIGRRVQRDR